MDRTYISDTKNKEGEVVEIFGWVDVRRDHGKLIFIDLRDRSGIAQIVFTPHQNKIYEIAQKLRSEWVLKVKGRVQRRPELMTNKEVETGKIEVVPEEVEILSEAKTPPFGIDTDGKEINEDTRMRFRYLDLRRKRLQKNLDLRHKVISYMRKFLEDRRFIEIETPILTKATPEGARDFVVPSRLQKGKFYALPQSPQQYKQLLMVAGFERYFQIARCFRDEDPRKDRAYGEFTQLDVEMSFVSQEEILNLIEEMFVEITEKVLEKQVFQKPFPRFTHEEAMKKFGADKFDLRKEKDSHVAAFAWVLDFPLFEKTETRALASSHHPFTAPKDEDLHLLDKNPLAVRSWQHDLVCNGLEIGGGSLRITNPDIQRKIFEILGHNKEEIEEKFGHLLEAFEYGVPPHGGVAPGIERFLMAVLEEENVREVAAFPISSGGQIAVMNAPSELSKEQLAELHLKIVD